MKTLFTTLLTLTLLAESQAQLPFPGIDGPGKGKKIVLIAGDEEYRSEETCPMLAKILSQHHGFDCTVIFSMDPTGTYIDPNNQKSLVGLGALKDADLMIIGTRFRQLSDAEYAIIADFLNAGKPVIGFRTATHAFSGKGQTGDFKWSQFGPQILGEGWVNHHGQHKKQGARGVIEAANANHPILNSVKDVFGESDVYGIKRVTPDNATILLRAAVTETLEPTSKPIAGEKNDPMQVAAWLREYTAPDGKGKGQAICTTLGSSVDFVSEDLRRLVVNGTYFLLKLEVPAKAEVTPVDEFKTTFFTNIQEIDYYKNRNLQPTDFVLGKSAATGLPGAKVPAEKSE